MPQCTPGTGYYQIPGTGHRASIIPQWISSAGGCLNTGHRVFSNTRYRAPGVDDPHGDIECPVDAFGYPVRNTGHRAPGILKIPGTGHQTPGIEQYPVPGISIPPVDTVCPVDATVYTGHRVLPNTRYRAPGVDNPPVDIECRWMLSDIPCITPDTGYCQLPGTGHQSPGIVKIPGTGHE